MALLSISCSAVRPPVQLSYLTASVSVFLTLITIPGNLLVCLAIIRDPFKNLRSPFNYFLLSLAATDLAVGVLMDPVSAIYHTSEGLQMDIVKIEILHVLYFILTTASILTLAALTADRYVAVTYPVKYKTVITSNRAKITSASIWFFALGFSFSYFKLGYIFYSFVFTNTAVISTFVVLIFVYTSIYKRLRERTKYWRDRKQHGGKDRDKENRDNIINSKKDSKVTKALILVLLIFFLSFTPACVMIYVMNFCQSCSCLTIHWLRDLNFLVVLCCSGINPYLYAWRLPQFKKAFMKFLHIRPRGPVSDIFSTTNPRGKIELGESDAACQHKQD